MTQRIAYYHVMIGLPGCLPDHHEFHAWETRHEMVRCISAMLESYGFPQRSRRQINIVEVWRRIQCGGKREHFIIRGGTGNPYILDFQQISAEDYHAAESDM